MKLNRLIKLVASKASLMTEMQRSALPPTMHAKLLPVQFPATAPVADMIKQLQFKHS